MISSKKIIALCITLVLIGAGYFYITRKTKEKEFIPVSFSLIEINEYIDGDAIKYINKLESIQFSDEKIPSISLRLKENTINVFIPNKVGSTSEFGLYDVNKIFNKIHEGKAIIQPGCDDYLITLLGFFGINSEVKYKLYDNSIIFLRSGFYDIDKIFIIDKKGRCLYLYADLNSFKDVESQVITILSQNNYEVSLTPRQDNN